jgi:hypothetical protein
MLALNAFSQQLADVLLGAYPEWQRFLRRAVDGSFTVLVACPSAADIQNPLIVTTERGEVTIEIDYCHSHFDWPEGWPGPFTNPLQFISAILSDEIATVSYWKEGKWAGSTYIGPLDDVDLNGFSGRVRVRSWRGTRNRDMQVATGC